MNKVKAVSLSILVVFLFFFSLSYPCSPSSSSPVVYYQVIQNENVMGSVEISRDTVFEGQEIITEKVFMPYDFFPRVSVLKVVIDRRDYSILSLEKQTRYDGYTEKILAKRYGDKISRLVDYKQIFYTDKDIPITKDLSFIEEESPFLLEEFMKRYGVLPGREVDVRYGVISWDSRPHGGKIIKEKGYYRFEGQFAVNIKLNDRSEITEYYLPSQDFKFRRSDKKPQLFPIPKKNPDQENGENNISLDSLSYVNTKSESVSYDEGNLVYSSLGQGETVLEEEGFPALVQAPPYTMESKAYTKVPVSFESFDGTILKGTLTIPPGKGPHPALVLIPGTGPYDRTGGGMFTEIADRLTRKGSMVLCYDKRGVGESGGNYELTTLTHRILDGDRAVNFLADYPGADKGRMGILGHSEGGYIASRIAMDNRNVRGLILIASPSTRMFPELLKEQLNILKNYNHWDPSAVESCFAMIDSLEGNLKKGKLWVDFMGERLFLGNLTDYYYSPTPLEIIRQLRMPVFILQGEGDQTVPTEHGQKLNRAVVEVKNPNYRYLQFSGLGHFMGDTVSPGFSYPFRKHIRMSDTVLKNLEEWVGIYYSLD